MMKGEFNFQDRYKGYRTGPEDYACLQDTLNKGITRCAFAPAAPGASITDTRVTMTICNAPTWAKPSQSPRHKALRQPMRARRVKFARRLLQSGNSSGRALRYIEAIQSSTEGGSK
ncbi:hypothetical protein PUN4_1330021 [Paraburkholderia unamae]|nr:hypothetical protein PUN4_1330021 [Paraburkholderia unamae]